MQDGNSPKSSGEDVAWAFPETYFTRDEEPEPYLESGESELPSSRSRGKRKSNYADAGKSRLHAQAKSRAGSRYSSSDSGVETPDIAEKAQLSPEKLERRAKNIVLHQLSRQAKSAFQLREVLTKREIPAEIIDSVIERFTEAGLIDDLQFAITVANSRRQTRGLSTSAIRRELIKKGVGAAEIDQALQNFLDEDELATAVRIATKRLRSMTNLEPEVRRRRMLGFLARKGYPGSIAYRALKVAEEHRAE